MREMPQRDGIDNDSPNKTMLKIVADIGSTMPSAAAVPTGRSFSARVYKK